MRNRLKSILVFNQNYIGDVVFTLPAIRALREGYPNSYIEIVLGRNPIEVLQGNPYADSLTMRPHKLSDKIALLKKIREKNYDICLSFSSRSVELALFAFLGRCKRRFGFFNPSTFLFYNFHLKENLENHSALDYLKLALAAGGKEVPLIPQIFLSEQDLLKAKEIQRDLHILGEEKIFAILLGGSTPFKRWHLPTLKSLLARLKDSGKIILFGGKEFRPFGDSLAKEFPNVYNLSGKISLRESLALLKSSSLFIG
ncbi:glycosyltransferase family 9 protein, partial [bacterium]|nr:glycosyltransferase family 9 protein [bacterium]